MCYVHIKLLVSQVLNVDTSYVAHYMRIPYRDYPGIFEKVLKGDEYRYKIEVDEMKYDNS